MLRATANLNNFFFLSYIKIHDDDIELAKKLKKKIYKSVYSTVHTHILATLRKKKKKKKHFSRLWVYF